MIPEPTQNKEDRSLTDIILDIISEQKGFNVISRENDVNPAVCKNIVLASFDSGRQVFFAAQKINKVLKELNLPSMQHRKKKNLDTDWIVVDCVLEGTMVHLAQEETRKYYELDELFLGGKANWKPDDVEFETEKEEGIKGDILKDYELLYEGKSKKVFKYDSDSVIQFYKNSVTAFNAKKFEELERKGKVTSEISSIIFELLESHNIDTHFIKRISEGAQLVRKLRMFKFEVTVRNMALGNLQNISKSSILGRSHFKKFDVIDPPIVEFMYKSDELSDPPISEDYIVHYLLDGNFENLATVKKISSKVNDILKPFFADIGIILGDFKLEFGLDALGTVRLGDEISPDTCRFLDSKTLESLDKDVFRESKGDLMIVYSEVLEKIQAKIALDF